MRLGSRWRGELPGCGHPLQHTPPVPVLLVQRHGVALVAPEQVLARPDTVADLGGVRPQRGQEPGQFPVREAGGQPFRAGTGGVGPAAGVWGSRSAGRRRWR